MNLVRICTALLLLAIAGSACAESPVALMEGYASQAVRSVPGFTPFR